jgi:Na+/proline symporter
MTNLDYIVIIVYGIGILFIGSILSKKNISSEAMFAVKKQSPWWLSGLSSFMSAFSAGTFVVWGGIAYKQGIVAVFIIMCSGISSFIVGKYFAKKWASLGISSIGEYVNIRFGKSAVQFYTWAGMLFKIIAMGVALYSFATLITSIIDVPPGSWYIDHSTGKLSKSVAIVISGFLMLAYAVSGGLWAVLIIDAIQFIVLTLTVLFVVPLCFHKIGGVGSFLSLMPSGFLSFTNEKFTFLFLIGWIIVHTFKLGGEWVFVQRFLVVSSPRNAQKASYLFGTLYLISPIVWMLPPMIYRVMNPNADPEQAYVLACSEVLPHGMMGLMLAAMFSSAASYIDGEINVYAGAVTNDFYKLIINPKASEKQLVLIGRVSSFLIGVVIIGIALLIPLFGGAEKIILTITSLLVVVMVLPVLWGLYFPGIKQNAIWISTGLMLLVAIYIKLIMPLQIDHTFSIWFIRNAQVLEVAIGIIIPLAVLSIMEFTAREKAAGFNKIATFIKQHEYSPDYNKAIAIFPAKILAYSIGALGFLMLLLLPTANGKAFLVGFFATVLLLLSVLILGWIRKLKN